MEDVNLYDERECYWRMFFEENDVAWMVRRHF